MRLAFSHGTDALVQPAAAGASVNPSVRRFCRDGPSMDPPCTPVQCLQRSPFAAVVRPGGCAAFAGVDSLHHAGSADATYLDADGFQSLDDTSGHAAVGGWRRYLSPAAQCAERHAHHRFSAVARQVGSGSYWPGRDTCDVNSPAGKPAVRWCRSRSFPPPSRLRRGHTSRAMGPNN